MAAPTRDRHRFAKGDPTLAFTERRSNETVIDYRCRQTTGRFNALRLALSRLPAIEIPRDYPRASSNEYRARKVIAHSPQGDERMPSCPVAVPSRDFHAGMEKRLLEARIILLSVSTYATILYGKLCKKKKKNNNKRNFRLMKKSAFSFMH